MSLGEQIANQLPYLRRYARALTGSQERGDELVGSTLEAAVADQNLKSTLSGGGRLALYRAFNQIWSEAVQSPGIATSDLEAAADARLQKVTPANRQALILTTLEEFSCAEAGSIMGLDAEGIEDLVRDAIAEIEREAATNVLIIEDEPLISMQLEDLVTSLGHKISGTAATHGQALNSVGRDLPGLVLADIQLADGSSGLDAVDDILAIAVVPVVFITAYPERLLTGCRREPTYLVTKPFKEATVRAAISQALFFNSEAPVATTG